MFEGHEHFLSFGSTDQETLRVLEGCYNGLLVPGTVAALQREGTGGFLLALSAAQARTAYVIDPRSPLFQQPLPAVKASFGVLASIFRYPEAATPGVIPSPSDFTDERVTAMAEGWLAFNEGYLSDSGSKFEKYAMRLNQNVRPDDARGPSAMLSPYMVAVSDDWWQVSLRLHEATLAAKPKLKAAPVVAVDDPAALATRASDLADRDIAVWVSGLDELDSTADSLLHYAQSLAAIATSGKRTFALYGGFVAVTLLGRGLDGFSHGIGYGDHRTWIELPSSGAPGPRYYIPEAHRYASREMAQRLFTIDPSLVVCGCAACGGRPPLTIEYHELMQHSVLCRAAEVAAMRTANLADVADDLDGYHERFADVIAGSPVNGTVVGKRLLELGEHLPIWSEVLRGI